MLRETVEYQAVLVNTWCNHTSHPALTYRHTPIFGFIMHSRYLPCYTHPTAAKIHAGNQHTAVKLRSCALKQQR